MTIAVAAEYLPDFTARLKACLRYCSDRSSQAAQESDLPRFFRSVELKETAESFLPDSCHTPPSEDLVLRFDDFVSARWAMSREQPLSRDVDSGMVIGGS